MTIRIESSLNDIHCFFHIHKSNINKRNDYESASLSIVKHRTTLIFITGNLRKKYTQLIHRTHIRLKH